MTLSTLLNRISYAGNGSTTAFSFPYYFLDDTDLTVILKVDSTGIETTKTLTTHYTVTGEGVQAGGTVTMLTAPASGETLIIYRAPALTQAEDIASNEAIPAETLESGLDKLTMIAQRLQYQLDNSLKLPSGETADMTLPVSATRASKYLAFDASGLPTASAVAAGSAVVSAFGATLIDDADAATARATLGFTGASGTVAAGNIEDSAVTTAKIASSAVTIPKLDLSAKSPWGLFNYSIAATVGSNALTIALKDSAGADPSASSPVHVLFRNATITTGTPVNRTVTGALSLVISSGSTLGHNSAVLTPIHIYLIDNAGTVELAASSTRLWDEQNVISTTAEGGSGDADSAVAIYSTAARTNVAIRYIGSIFSNQATAGTYASAITRISLSTGNVPKMPYSEVHVYGGNGYGSTNTKIRRYSNILSNVGSAITYADSATLGGSFTINEPGLYHMRTIDVQGAASAAIGISLNSSQLTTTIDSLTSATAYLGSTVTVSNNAGACECVKRLIPGDVIRAHSNGTCNGTGLTNSQFHIIKIAD